MALAAAIEKIPAELSTISPEQIQELNSTLIANNTEDQDQEHVKRVYVIVDALARIQLRPRKQKKTEKKEGEEEEEEEKKPVDVKRDVIQLVGTLQNFKALQKRQANKMLGNLRQLLEKPEDQKKKGDSKGNANVSKDVLDAIKTLQAALNKSGAADEPAKKKKTRRRRDRPRKEAKEGEDAEKGEEVEKKEEEKKEE